MSPYTPGTRSITKNAHEKVGHTIYDIYMFNFKFEMLKDILFCMLWYIEKCWICEASYVVPQLNWEIQVTPQEEWRYICERNFFSFPLSLLIFN